MGRVGSPPRWREVVIPSALRLDRPEVGVETMRAWATHLGRPIESAVSLRRELAAGTLPAAFAATAERRPHAPALSIGEDEISHGELDAAAARAGSALRRLGAGPGRTILLVVSTSVSEIVAYLGGLRSGATVVLADPTYTARELGELGRDSGASWAVSSGVALQRLSGEEAGISELVGLRSGDARTASVLLDDLAGDPLPVVPIDPAGPAILAYTSGSTGTPKGVPLSHRNLLASIRGVMWSWRWSPDDCLVHSLPISHQHGLGGVHATLLAGSRAVLLERFEPGRLLGAIQEERASVLFAVPAMYQRLLEEQGIGALERLRLFTSGSAPLPIRVADELGEAVGSLPLERYGSTEAGLDISNPYDGPRIPGTVGIPLPGVELTVVDGDDRPVEPGTAGEVLLRGPQVFAGYRGAAPDGEGFLLDWFRTGDVGVVDPASGHLSLVGRSKEVIISGGMNVYPREVERALAAVPGVVDVAVLGLPSERWGEQVVGFVVLRGVSSAEAAAAIADRLAPYKRPKQIVPVSHIPRNQMGKVSAEDLRALLVTREENAGI